MDTCPARRRWRFGGPGLQRLSLQVAAAADHKHDGLTEWAWAWPAAAACCTPPPPEAQTRR
jgi:hypothetical protein